MLSVIVISALSGTLIISIVLIKVACNMAK